MEDFENLQNTWCDRLKKVGVKQRAFAKTVGRTETYISTIFSNKIKPGSLLAKEIETKLRAYEEMHDV